MDPLETILDCVKLASQLDARLALIVHNPQLAKSAKEALYGSRWGVESLLDDLVKALARQQVAAHLHTETSDVETPSA